MKSFGSLIKVPTVEGMCSAQIVATACLGWGALDLADMTHRVWIKFAVVMTRPEISIAVKDLVLAKKAVVYEDEVRSRFLCQVEEGYD